MRRKTYVLLSRLRGLRATDGGSGRVLNFALRCEIVQSDVGHPKAVDRLRERSKWTT